MANMGTRWQVSSVLQAPVVLANKSTRHRRQAMYCKPQRSWPTRAQGIVGKQHIVFQQAPAVLANEGSRHRGWDTSFDSKPQRSGQTRALYIMGKLCQWWQSCKRLLMGQCTTMPEWHQQEGFFFAGKATARGINFGRIVEATSHFWMQKSNAQEVKSTQAHGSPLERWTK